MRFRNPIVVLAAPANQRDYLGELVANEMNAPHLRGGRDGHGVQRDVVDTDNLADED